MCFDVFMVVDELTPPLLTHPLDFSSWSDFFFNTVFLYAFCKVVLIVFVPEKNGGNSVARV